MTSRLWHQSLSLSIQKDLQFTCFVVKNPAGNSEPSPHNIVQKLHSKSLATVCSVRKKIK